MLDGFTILGSDGTPATILSTTTGDTNSDGTVDEITISFSEAVDLTGGSENDWSLAASSGTATIDVGSYSVTAQLTITYPITVTDTENTALTIQPSYVLAGTGVIDDQLNNELFDTQTVAVPATGVIDGAPPAIISATTVDGEAGSPDGPDGQIDGMTIILSEALDDAGSDLANAFDVTGYGGEGSTSGTVDDNTLNLTFTESGTGDTDQTPDVQLVATTLFDPTGNSLAGNQTFTSVVDGAAPAIVDAAYQDANADGFIDQFEFTFSEAIVAASSNFSRNDINLTSVGDFTSADFGNDATDLSADGTSLVVTLATASSNRVTEDLSGLAISTLNSFQLSDGTNTNSTLTSQDWVVFTDEAYPIITDLSYEDNDEDGRIDQIEFFFSEDLDAASVLRPNDLSFDDDGDFDGALFGTGTGNSVGAGGELDAIVVLGTEATVIDTEENSALLAVNSQNGFSLVDDAGNINNVLTTQTQANTIDAAAPQIADFEYLDGFDAGETQGDGRVDAIRLTFSESLDASSFLSNNDLTFNDVGDFTGADFGADVTDLVTSGITTLEITLGTEATVEDTEENSGALRIDSQNAFSLSDGTNTNNVLKIQTLATGGQATLTDGAAPALVSSEYQDTNADGEVEKVIVTYSEDITASTFEAGDWDFPNNVDGLVVDAGSFTANELDIDVSSSPNNNTALNASFTVQYTDQGTAGSIIDNAGNVSPTSLVTGVSDAAPPQIAEFIYEDVDPVGEPDGQIDQFRVVFTETLDAASVLSANDLTFNDVGDFTGAAFGADGTDLITSAVTEVVVVLGTASSNVDTEENSNSLQIFTQNGFSLTDGVNVNAASGEPNDISYVDGAAPQIVSFEYQDGDADGRIDQFEVTFSENLDGSSQLTPNDLQLDNVGDFTSAAFGASTTNTVVAESSTATVPLGNESTEIDTEENSGSLLISSINGFSISDGINANTLLREETTNFLDGASPVVVQSVTLDTNEDGDVDRVELEVSEPIDDSEFTGEAGNFALTPPAAFGTADVMVTFDSDVTDINGGVAVNNDEFFSYTFTPTNSTGTGVFVLDYTPGAVDDGSGNILDIPSVTMTDGAAPRVRNLATDLTPADDATGLSGVTEIQVQYSEEVDFNSGGERMYFVQIVPPETSIYSVSEDPGLVTFDTDGLVTLDVPTTISNAEYYIIFESGALQDDANNESANQFNAATVWNFATANELVAAEASPNVLAGVFVTFNEDVTIIADDVNDFTITDGIGNTFPVTSIDDGTPADNQIELVVDLSTAVGDLTIDFDGAISGGGTTDIEDISSGSSLKLDDFTGLEVNLDTSVPTVGTTDGTVARISDTELRITFDGSEPVQLLTTGFESDFVVVDRLGDAGSVTYTVTGIDDNTSNNTLVPNNYEIVLTMAGGGLSTAVGDISVEYTNNNNGIGDFGENILQDFSLTDNLDAIPPTIDAITELSTTRIQLDFSEQVQIVTSAPADDFTLVDGAGNNYVVSTVDEDGDATNDILELSVQDFSGALGDLFLSYSRTSSQISDYGANDLGVVTNQLYDRDVVAPSLSGATITTEFVLDVSFDEEVAYNDVNAQDEFTIVDEAGNAFTVAAVQDFLSNDDQIRITVNESLFGAIGDLIITYDNTDGDVEDFGSNLATGGTISLDLDLDVQPTITELVQIPYDNLITPFTIGETVTITTPVQTITATVEDDDGIILTVSAFVGDDVNFIDVVTDDNPISGSMGGDALVNSADDVGILENDDTNDIVFYRSITDPGTNVPWKVTPQISGSTINIYDDSGLTSLVASATNVTGSFFPDVADIMSESGVPLTGNAVNGVYTFYITEVSQNGATSESDAVIHSLAFADQIGNSVNTESFIVTDIDGTILTVEHPNGQDLLFTGNGLTNTAYNEGGTSQTQFIPSSAGDGNIQVSLRWENQTSGVVATFAPVELNFRVNESSEVLDAVDGVVAFSKEAGATLLAMNSDLTNIDDGADTDDPDNSDFYSYEAYYIKNGSPASEADFTTLVEADFDFYDINNEPTSVYQGGSTDKNIATTVLSYSGANSGGAYTPGTPLDIVVSSIDNTSVWSVNPSALNGEINTGQTVDTLRIVSVGIDDAGSSKFTIAEVDLYFYPTPQVTLKGLSSSYCEDEEEVDILIDVFTYTGGDSEADEPITNGYMLYYNPSTNFSVTPSSFNLLADSTSTGSVIENTFDPRQVTNLANAAAGKAAGVSAGWYQIVYTSEEYTPANLVGTTTFEFYIVDIQSAPVLDLSYNNLSDQGGFDGSKYVFEYRGDSTVSSIVIDTTAATGTPADGPNTQYNWYLGNGTLISSGTHKLDSTLSTFLTSNPFNNYLSRDLYVTRVLDGCESDSIPIEVRIYDVPREITINTAENVNNARPFDYPGTANDDFVNVNELRGEYFFEYCGASGATITYDDLNIITNLEDPQDRSTVEDRSYFRVYADAGGNTRLFDISYLDPYVIDLNTNTDIGASTTASATANFVIEQEFWISKVVGDSSFTDPAAPFTGAESPLTKINLAIYTYPELPAIGDFTGDPQEVTDVINYYMCSGEAFPDVGIDPPSLESGNNNETRFEWFTDTNLMDTVDLGNNRGEVVTLQDLENHAAAPFSDVYDGSYDPADPYKNVYTYYVRSVTNINRDSEFLGCESGLKQVNITVFPEAEVPDADLVDPTLANRSSIDEDNFDFVYEFCVDNTTGLADDILFETPVVADSITFENEILWYVADAGANNIINLNPIVAADGANQVTSGDLQMTGSKNIEYYFAVEHRTNFQTGYDGFDGCTAELTFVKVVVSTNPEPQFTYQGLTEGRSTTFNFIDQTSVGELVDANMTITRLSDSAIEADFTVTGVDLDAADDEFIHSFSGPGLYDVTLTITSAAGCRRDVTRQIQILEQITVTNNVTYDFSNSNEGWFAEFRSDDGLEGSADNSIRTSSWSYGDPNNGTIGNISIFVTDDANDTEAWSTTGTTVTSNGPVNRYVGGEESYIYSPSYDISALSNPAVSFATNSDIDGIKDGVALQYSTDDGATWITLGDYDETQDRSSGINWYTSEGLSNVPGNSRIGGGASGFNIGGYAWTGSSSGWVISTHTLVNSAANGSTNVRFRFALAATGNDGDAKVGDGFAFDEMSLFELEKVVLVENFTSVIYPPSKYIDSLIYDNRNDGNVSALDLNSTMLINYFTDFANFTDNTGSRIVDPLNERNTNGPGARAATYGVETAVTSVLDGEVFSGDLSTYDPNDLSTLNSLSRSFDETSIQLKGLEPTNLNITNIVDNTIGSGINNMVSVTATIGVNSTNDLTDVDYSVFFAIVEDIIPEFNNTEIPENIGLYTVGDTIRNALRIMQPGPAGTSWFTEQELATGVRTITAGDERTFSVDWEINGVYDPAKLRVIVFIQDNDPRNADGSIAIDGTRKIIQAGFIDITGATAEVLGAIDGVSEFNVYPNPADEAVTIEFDDLVEKSADWILFDQLGREVLKGSVDKGTKSMRLKTEDIPSGMYFFQLFREDERARAKRIVIAH